MCILSASLDKCGSRVWYPKWCYHCLQVINSTLRQDTASSIWPFYPTHKWQNHKPEALTEDARRAAESYDNTSYLERNWCACLSHLGAFVGRQISHAVRHVQSTYVGNCATACFLPLAEGWPGCFKLPVSLRIPTCSIDALLLGFNGNYYQHYSAGRD